MITHYAEVKLQTTSVAGVKQFFSERLGYPVASEYAEQIEVRVNAHTRLTFQESHERLAPVHLAFEVPMAVFDQVVLHLQQLLGIPLAWPDGITVTTFTSGKSVYYKDLDGNLLEWTAHYGITDEVLVPEGLLQVMYLREVGLPVHDVGATTAWFQANLGMKVFKSSELFAFVRGGTAHAVVVSTSRKWIPIGMIAIPPHLTLVLGVSGAAYITQIADRLEGAGYPISWSLDQNELSFQYAGYLIVLRHTPGFLSSWVDALNLPEE